MLRSMALIAVPLAFITLGVALVTLAWTYNNSKHRARESAAIARQAKEAANQAALLAIKLDEERLRRDNELAWQVYDECVENENQDEANTALYRKVRAVVAEGPPTDKRDALLQSLSDTISAREPPGEKDCQLPKGKRPGPRP